ncbi:unnamed protein product (macronuclear) [Paramecium tetraurelia]|uniref:RING-type E3 ubiquitin transferase n=1 Tax=Paramecium tetraurelia TaxID=5888 RepID=A0BJW9_PARTE|nr:uncharacterized protein GSPATT00029466001 [Paramecium tetraurelia]CAK58836.1 unnamed protein product [Paramecium tetraurelia]|eukprot:XP_001426234.1 hypothetical protein (macronuclear) [Paramecium tetraurelia strain d4-2]
MNNCNAEDHILKISNESDNLKDEDLILQALNINQEEYQSAIICFRDVGTKSLCANRINELELSYQCFDCSKDTSHIICKECFIPEIHKNHAVQIVQMSSLMQGYCDCGDTFMLDRNSMCPKHLQKEMKVENKQIEKNPVFKKYEKFLLDAFGLFYKKLAQFIDYPDDLLENIENIIKHLKNEILDIYFNSNNIYFVSIKDSISEAKKIHSLIFRTLQIITNDNIIWGYLTGKILKQEFQILINKQQFKSTSLLEQYLQNNARLEGCLKFEQDISTFFPLFFQDEDFRTRLSTCVIQNFKNFYALVCSYELITNKNKELTFQIYKDTKDQKLAVLVEKILACSQIEEIKSKNSLIQGAIIQKFFLFMQRGYIEMLRLYKTVQSPVHYQLFKIVSDLILEIPLIEFESLKICSSYSYGIELMAKCKKAINGQINQIQEILEEDFSAFKFQLLNPNSNAFQKLLNESLLIYSLTRRHPCQQLKSCVLYYPSDIQQKEMCLNYSLIISQKMLSSFRYDLKSILLTFDHLHSFDVQNILRIILNYFLNNLVSSFVLKNSCPIQLIAFNYVLNDRNFIIVLAIYLLNYSNSQDAYNNVLELSGLAKSQFNQIMHQILKRTLLNYIIFQSPESFEYYKGDQDYWKNLENEVSLQQVDVTYIQLYAFMFQDQGINHIIQGCIEIQQHLKQKINLSFLICKIAQTDYDYIQCVGSITGNQFNEQFQKGLAKLFQTVFYTQTFYNLNEMRTLLKEFRYENKIDLETLILSSCEINQDNGQLQLKKELKLHIYEPIYAAYNENIKEKINDQLQMQNDKFVELFGSSLEYELKYYGTPKSTLTNIRYEILKAISQDQNQYLLEIILKDLENTLQSNTGFIKQLDASLKILQENAIYINLLYLSDQMFSSNNAKIQHLVDKIQHYSQVFILLDKFIVQDFKTKASLRI